MVFKNCLGIIKSVSILMRGNGATVAVNTVNGCMDKAFAVKKKGLVGTGNDGYPQNMTYPLKSSRFPPRINPIGRHAQNPPCFIGSLTAQ
jgi:hypothetical protein